MPIRWSRIHAELGLSPTPLTHAWVVRAVKSGMAEADDLDWKQALPPEVEKKRRDVAKDVAAMANTRGGLIVYGVREENERAVELTGVSNGERDRQALRSFANRYVRPLVDGLMIEAFDGEDGEPGLIAMFVRPRRSTVRTRSPQGWPARAGCSRRHRPARSSILSDEFRSAVATGNRNLVRGVNYRFHRRIYEVADLPQTMYFVQTLWARYPVEIINHDESRYHSAATEHAELLRYLIVGDVDNAVLWTRRHIERGWEALQQMVKARSERAR